MWRPQEPQKLYYSFNNTCNYFDKLLCCSVHEEIFILPAWPQTENSLEDTGSKHSGEVEGSHAVFLVVALHKGEEVTEVAEEAVVDVW